MKYKIGELIEYISDSKRPENDVGIITNIHNGSIFIKWKSTYIVCYPLYSFVIENNKIKNYGGKWIHYEI